MGQKRGTLALIMAQSGVHVNWRGIAHAFYKILAGLWPFYRLSRKLTSWALIAAKDFAILAHFPRQPGEGVEMGQI